MSSYFFYGWWSWKFLSLIAISTLVDFFVGLGFSNLHSGKRRKALLCISIIVNLGLLGFFPWFSEKIKNKLHQKENLP